MNYCLDFYIEKEFFTRITGNNRKLLRESVKTFFSEWLERGQRGEYILFQENAGSNLLLHTGTWWREEGGRLRYSTKPKGRLADYSVRVFIDDGKEFEVFGHSRRQLFLIGRRWLVENLNSGQLGELLLTEKLDKNVTLLLKSLVYKKVSSGELIQVESRGL